MYTSSSLLPLLALALTGLSTAAPASRGRRNLYQAPMDIAPPAELPAVPQVDAWSAAVNFETIPTLHNGHYCHVPSSKQILAANEISLRPSRDGHTDFQLSIDGTMPVADTLPGATMTIAVHAVAEDRAIQVIEPRSYTAPINGFHNVVIRQRSHGYDASVMINGLAPFRDLEQGNHTIRLHAVVPDGRTLFCIETDWTVDGAAAAIDELDAWRGTRDRN